MKTIFVSLVILLIASSCGKYERPFISFSSPEKRLTGKTWIADRILKPDGTEETTSETFKFTISGNDSIFERKIDSVLYIGTWSWRPGLKGKIDKQKIIVNVDLPNITLNRFVYDIKVLKSNELEMIDMNGHLTANYKYFLTN
jgi:hypothetical protein